MSKLVTDNAQARINKLIELDIALRSVRKIVEELYDVSPPTYLDEIMLQPLEVLEHNTLKDLKLNLDVLELNNWM